MDIDSIEQFNIKRIQFALSGTFFEYSKFVLHKQLYTSKNYSNKVKTNDSAIKLDDGQYGEIIKFFKNIEEDDIFLLINVHEINVNHFIGHISRNYAVINTEKEVNTFIISTKSIKKKCVFIDLDHVKYFSDQIIFYD